MFCSGDFSAFVGLPDVPPDPGMMKQWEHVFAETYQHGHASVDAVEPSGRITISDIGNDFGISSPKVRLRGRYFFPVDTAGAATISARKTSYPLVVIVHANGSVFTDYDWLGRHLARNGFIAAAVNLLIAKSRARLSPVPGMPGLHFVEGSEPILVFEDPTSQIFQVDPSSGALTLLPMVMGVDFDIDPAPPPSIEFLRRPRDFHGLAARGRANVMFKHLEVLKHKFAAQVENKIGLLGHSRGGEAVVRAAGTIGTSSAPADLRNIVAIISLAPTDRYEKENLTQNIPYFVLYGSKDGDVSGIRENRRMHLRPSDPTVHSGSGGFSLYDRASNATVKSMAFVYGATHNGFITTSERDPKWSLSTAPGSPEVNISGLDDRKQRAAARAYLNAFMRQHVLGEAIWRSYFTGEFIPGSVTTDKIFLQYKEMAPASFDTLDDFEDVAVDDPAISSSGQAVVHNRGGTGLDEGFLNPFAPSIDQDSPHETFGLKVTGWMANDTLAFTVTTNVAGKDVTAFSHLSFRLTQVARRVNSRIDDLKVVVEDILANRFAAPLGRTIPDPDHKFLVKFRPAPLPPLTFNLTKSAFLTIRIPLSIYTANGIDLTKVKLVRFEFPTTGAGNIEIDNVDFTS
jgi:dienelactone hydrolase